MSSRSVEGILKRRFKIKEMPAEGVRWDMQYSKAVAAIERLIIEAKIEELEKVYYSTSSKPSVSIVTDRIAELRGQL